MLNVVAALLRMFMHKIGEEIVKHTSRGGNGKSEARKEKKMESSFQVLSAASTNLLFGFILYGRS